MLILLLWWDKQWSYAHKPLTINQYIVWISQEKEHIPFNFFLTCISNRKYRIIEPRNTIQCNIVHKLFLHVFVVLFFLGWGGRYYTASNTSSEINIIWRYFLITSINCFNNNKKGKNKSKALSRNILYLKNTLYFIG